MAIDEKKLIEVLKQRIASHEKDAAEIDGYAIEFLRLADEVQAIIEVIEEQPKVNEWIPCSEKLPEGCEDAEIEVLISTQEKYPDAFFQESGFALYYPKTKTFHSVYGDRLEITEIVKAWMSMPPAYKEGLK